MVALNEIGKKGLSAHNALFFEYFLSKKAISSFKLKTYLQIKFDKGLSTLSPLNSGLKV